MHSLCQRIRWQPPVAALAMVVLGSAPSRAQMPSTDIWLAELRVSGNEIRVGRPENVTRRAGYDNQPCFLPDGRAFLYTRSDGAGTDVYRFDRASGRSERLTDTPESEYSPTPLRDPRDGFCVVRVEADSTQRLWRFERDGSRPRLVAAAVDSVGYFAWLDESTIAVFVVGSPHTLRWIDLASGRETTAARDVGRSLHRIPGRDELSFLVRSDASEPARYTFFAGRPNGPPPRRLIDGVGSAQDAAWIDDALVMSDGATLFAARPFEAPTWRAIADLSAHGLSGVTRVAVSPDHRWIALVSAEPAE